MSTLDDILAIPGNRPVYQRLCELLDERKAIAFAGAPEQPATSAKDTKTSLSPRASGR